MDKDVTVIRARCVERSSSADRIERKMEDAAASTGSGSGRKRPRSDNSINNNIGSAAGGRGGRSHHQNGRGGSRHRTKNHSRRTVRPSNNNNHGAASMNSNRNNNNAQRKHHQHQQQGQNFGSQQRTNNRSARLEENDRNNASNKTKTLPWLDPHSHYIPLQEEERLLPSLLHWGKSERGMMKDQPPFRLKKIQKLLLGEEINNNNNHRCMTLLQSLSLRRTHLKHLQPRLSMPQLKLGSEADIRHSAAIFEQVVQNYLRRCNVLECFMTEEDQRRMNRKRGGRMPPSPDFRVRDGHCVQLDFENRRRSGGKRSATDPSPSTTINWIEAKMFYGASTIPTNTPNAVGAILPKMTEYVSLYGAGAIVFMYGCGDVLARQLLDIGVVALDCRGLDVAIVEESQRGWCADARGTILF